MKQLKESISASCIAESILDNDMKILSNDINNLCKKYKFRCAAGKKTDSNKAPWASWWFIDMTV